MLRRRERATPLSRDTNRRSDMKMNTLAKKPGSYVQLQRQIHYSLREQHPEWIEQNGAHPTWESYESGFAELAEPCRKLSRFGRPD